MASDGKEHAMAYNTPETVADYLARFQMEITHRGKGTFTPDHVKYSLTIASGGKDFFTTFESNPHVHGEPTITQVFGALASDAMVVRDYGMDEFVDEFCDGMKPSAAHRASYPLVEFYDTSQDAARFPGGQFVSRYYMTDLLEDDSIAVSLDTMLKNGNQFSLDGGIPAWTVEGDDLAKVNDFLKKSCMEFCGSLPGDEKDEDGYSLSGEAKDATASRNGLSRNQMGIEEKAAECKEAATVLANGNAL